MQLQCFTYKKAATSLQITTAAPEEKRPFFEGKQLGRMVQQSQQDGQALGDILSAMQPARRRSDVSKTQ